MRQLSPYLPREALTSMNPQQIQYAKQQLHLLLSQQMSKVSMGLSKRQKIGNNLLELQRKEQQLMNHRIQHLNNKFSHTGDKRKKVLDERIAQCKLHDKKLEFKMAEMQRRRNQEEREAAKKSRTYSIDLLNYLKQKEMEQFEIQQRIKKEFQNKERLQSINDMAMAETGSRRENREGAKNSNNKLAPSVLDESIRKHQRRAKTQHQKTVEVTFQKILKKMDMMNAKKKRMLREKELKETHKTAENRQNRVTESYEMSEKEWVRESQPSNYESESKRYKRTIDYVAIKREKEMKEFQERGEMFNRMKEKDRREGILKQLKQKVREQKINMLNNTK